MILSKWLSATKKMTEIKFEVKTKTAICFIFVSVTWIIKQTVFWIKTPHQQVVLLVQEHQSSGFTNFKVCMAQVPLLHLKQHIEAEWPKDYFTLDLV